jgi:tripartite-type tricarboxylate transporter receptor subunit TctC
MKLMPLVLLFFAGQVLAQPYPARSIRLVVGFAPGGAADVVARTLQEPLQRNLGQPIVVDNRPGAGSSIAAEYVAKSAADGYTLLIASIGLAANPSLYKKLAFEPQSDLEPITLIANSPTVLAVPPSLPVNSLA